MINQKKDYDKMFAILREELNKLDVLKVLEHHTKLNDEYDLENQMILSSINEDMNYVAISKIMKNIFEETLSEKFEEEIFYCTAKNILERIKNL